MRLSSNWECGLSKIPNKVSTVAHTSGTPGGVGLEKGMGGSEALLAAPVPAPEISDARRPSYEIIAPLTAVCSMVKGHYSHQVYHR